MGTQGIVRGAREARLQELLDRFARRRRVPHVVMGVAAGDGSFRWKGATGAADASGTPMTADTPFFIASVTKLFIAVTALQLHERGDLDLDAPITSYLPDDAIAGIHVRDGVDNTPRITVRHLLSHTSGLPDFLEDRPPGQPSMYREIVKGRDRSWVFADVVARVRTMPPRFPPQDLTADRQKARYSDTGFQILIAIVESVTGRPFAQVLEDRIFRPLDLRNTYLPGHSQPLDPTPAPAEIWDKGRVLSIPLAMDSFNDLVSTTDDTLRFLHALIRGEVFADPSTYRMMRERWNRIFYPMRYGLGMMRFPIARPFGPGRRAATLVGHSGATGSWLFHCPEVDLLLTGTIDDVGGRALPYKLILKVLRALHT